MDQRHYYGRWWVVNGVWAVEAGIRDEGEGACGVEGWIGSTGSRLLSGRIVVEHMAVVGVVEGCLEIPL
jgi:hypothetical protein